MTDMRATERLLEVIQECVDRLPQFDQPEFAEITDAVTELRRRGDTLVRRDDLMRVLEWVNPERADEWPTHRERMENVYRKEVGDVTEQALDALDRLENVIGGKL